MNASPIPYRGQRPQLMHCATAAARSAACAGVGNPVCVVAASAQNAFMARRQALRFTYAAVTAGGSVSGQPPHFATQYAFPAAMSCSRASASPSRLSRMTFDGGVSAMTFRSSFPLEHFSQYGFGTVGLPLCDAPRRPNRSVRFRTAKLKREVLFKREFVINGQLTFVHPTQARVSPVRACCSSRSSPAVERSPGRALPHAAGGLSSRDQANRARRSITPRIHHERTAHSGR